MSKINPANPKNLIKIPVQTKKISHLFQSFELWKSLLELSEL